jgi:hypothetical protein
VSTGIQLGCKLARWVRCDVMCSSIYLTAELVQNRKVFGREVGEGGGGSHDANRRGELSDRSWLWRRREWCGRWDGYECDGVVKSTKRRKSWDTRREACESEGRPGHSHASDTSGEKGAFQRFKAILHVRTVEAVTTRFPFESVPTSSRPATLLF